MLRRAHPQQRQQPTKPQQESKQQQRKRGSLVQHRWLYVCLLLAACLAFWSQQWSHSGIILNHDDDDFYHDGSENLMSLLSRGHKKAWKLTNSFQKGVGITTGTSSRALRAIHAKAGADLLHPPKPQQSTATTDTNTKANKTTNKKYSQLSKVLDKINRRKQAEELSEFQEWQHGWALGQTMDFGPQNFSQYPILHTAELPDMTTQKGGVIFFLHIPKTGGQSIRHNFGFHRMQNKRAKLSLLQEMKIQSKLYHSNNKNNTDNDNHQLLDLEQPMIMDPTNSLATSNIRYVWANYLEVFLEKAVPKINNYLSSPNNNGKILFVEVHGMDNYHAQELEPYLHAWRQRSQETQVPFFAFTILREPIAEQVSFFNFYFLHPGDVRFCNTSLTTSTRCYAKRKNAKKTKRQRMQEYVANRRQGQQPEGTEITQIRNACSWHEENEPLVMTTMFRHCVTI